ncbi:amidase [Bordetella genomosp. 13]|uniref:amidase n=1 Tax=Bordetella genomosp. 13 TaxID=463040 RepID=UPI0021B61251|nr:amidase [Bordetella genomosp. 13]
MSTTPGTSADPADLDAGELSQAYALGAVTPLQAVEALLARIEAEDGRLGAYVDVYRDEAIMAARSATEAYRAGAQVGPWHGVPIAVKDLVEIGGKPCLAGAASRRGMVSQTTATLVRRLRGHGAIVLGKTHTVEFAYGGWGTNALMGTPRNPWDASVHRTPGGSSSGSAVAVAARLAPWAIGTDTGGSVRTPAAFNGLTGLKVSHGRVSLHGIVPLCPSLDTPGFITRSVGDAASLLEMLQGPDPRDPSTAGVAPVEVRDGLSRGVRGLRLARMPQHDRLGCEAAVLDAYDRAVAQLADLGAEIVDVELPMPLADYTTHSAVMLAEAHAMYGALAADAAVAMDPAVRARILAGDMPASRYLQARWAREDNAAAFVRALGDADVLLTPTVRTAAIPVDSVDERTTPAILTRVVNQLNLCALAVPAGFNAEGLPLSLQIIGRRHQEAMVLRVGQAYQEATSWHLRSPR